ncbi:MAG: sorbosone dehydrogenase family protein, partial [Chloroflexota bacterium]
MSVENRPGSLSGMPDDRLGTAAVALVVSEVRWSPDVAPAVMDRISRDAVAYPEQFDRRPAAPTVEDSSPPAERSSGRSARRVAVFALLLTLVVALVFIAASADISAAVGAEPGDISIRLEPVADGFDQPILVTNAGDSSGNLFVVEQPGRIRIVRSDGTVMAEPFLDLSSRVRAGGERGLLGLAFHPDYSSNGRLFVNYTREPDGATVVSEFAASEGSADPDSERVLLVVEQPFANHNGGMVAFDAGGRLLVGMGDGGSGGDPLGAGQDPSTLLGKLLRLDVDGAEPYGIPADNGFAGNDAYRPEIHAKGLRNPWRFSVDPVGGHIYIGDVGAASWEEIDVLPGGVGGQDFGWSEMEGPDCFRADCDPEAYTAPTIFYGRDDGCSVIGGEVYRGAAQPLLEGTYLFGDLCTGIIWGVSAEAMVSGEAEATPLGRMPGTLVSF